MSERAHKKRAPEHALIDKLEAWCDRVLFSAESAEPWPRSQRHRKRGAAARKAAPKRATRRGHDAGKPPRRKLDFYE
jgi:hypothetical protein